MWRTSRTISIHALREESDLYKEAVAKQKELISIHALREESDFKRLLVYQWRYTFQSTLSARRATQGIVAYYQANYNFNPRSPRGERPSESVGGWSKSYISIHALREESDHCLPCPYHIQRQISIHALREESDIWNLFIYNHHLYFNPRSPRGERQRT